MIDFQISSSDPVVIAGEGEHSAFAVDQLVWYLRRVLGHLVERSGIDGRWTVAIVCRADAGLSDEGYRFEMLGRSLRIVAGGALGASYGVFAFLRDGCGCRFAGLAPDGEFVPHCDEVRFTDDGRPHEPVLSYRGLQFTTLDPMDRQVARLDWMLKNGLNRVVIRFNPDEEAIDEVDPQTGIRHGGMGSEGPRMTAAYVDGHLLPAILQRGLKPDISHHNLRCWLPPRRLLGQHPQWFAMHDGERGSDLRQLCICTSNAEAVAALAVRLDEYLCEHPQVRQIGVIPEDGMGMCECPACVAMDDLPDDATRPWMGPLHPNAVNFSKARRYARLLNAVADVLRDRHPDVTIVGAAYVDLAYPPLDVEPADNVAMWLAIYWRDGARPLRSDSSSAINRRFRGLIEQWSARLAGRLYLYEYYMGMNAQHSLPYPMSRVIAAEWTQIGAIVQGATVQCLTGLHEAYGLNLLTFARAGWTREVNHDAVLDDWLLGMFGAAAEAVRPIYQRWCDAVSRIAEQDGLRGHTAARYLDGDMLKPDARNIVYLMADMPDDWVRTQMETAHASAREPRERRQIEWLSHYLSYCRCAVTLVTAIDDGSADDVAAALDALLAHVEHPAAQGWIAHAHAQRWRRMARTRLIKELTQ